MICSALNHMWLKQRMHEMRDLTLYERKYDKTKKTTQTNQKKGKDGIDDTRTKEDEKKDEELMKRLEYYHYVEKRLRMNDIDSIRELVANIDSQQFHVWRAGLMEEWNHNIFE